MLGPSAAVPCPPVSFPGGLRGQVLGDVFCRVRGGWTRGCRNITFQTSIKGIDNMNKWQEVLCAGLSIR